MTAVPGLVVAATGSGRGKTGLAVGLMAAFRRRGLRVQAFKAGPDFIDPAHHARATGRVSHNLDTWMLSEAAVRETFARHAAHAGLAVVEGVMGLFDGISGRDDAGSTARLARLLGLPVLLAVDVRGLGRSVAALVTGFAAFDPGLTLCGVVCNQVGGPGHREILAEAMADVPGVPVVGFLPRDPCLAMPSRHLGLVDPAEAADADSWVAAWADAVEKGLDLDGLLARLPRCDLSDPPPARGPEVRVRLGVARDAAFRFYYEENLRLLAQAGAEIATFSPVSDPVLPPGLDGLYLGGGYPELFAAKLAENASMRRSVAAFAASGRPIYAECGGFMYLMDSLTDASGQRFPMAGVFPLAAAMGPRFAALGYREARPTAPTLRGPAGTVVRGHEFHYSRLVENPAGVETAYALSGRTGPLPDPEGFRVGTVLGSYVHLHFGSRPDAARSFVRAMARARTPHG
jgi:cobyrinic acid a,c-diamide synthase